MKYALILTLTTSLAAALPQPESDAASKATTISWDEADQTCTSRWDTEDDKTNYNACMKDWNECKGNETCLGGKQGWGESLFRFGPSQSQESGATSSDTYSEQEAKDNCKGDAFCIQDWEDCKHEKVCLKSKGHWNGILRNADGPQTQAKPENTQDLSEATNYCDKNIYVRAYKKDGKWLSECKGVYQVCHDDTKRGIVQDKLEVLGKLSDAASCTGSYLSYWFSNVRNADYKDAGSESPEVAIKKLVNSP